MNNGSGPDVVEVISQVRDGLEEAQKNGRSFKGCIIFVVDHHNGWAASTSGLGLEELKNFLQTARDNAVLGGDGYTVMVPKEEKPALAVVQ